MDIYLMVCSFFKACDYKFNLLMSWRDPRLVSTLATILVKEEEILEKIWRPDP
jgi:hypothetical protein